MSRHKSSGITRRTMLGVAGAVGVMAAATWPASLAWRRGREVAPGRLRIASGGVGGVYYAYAGGIASAVHARLPQLTTDLIVTAASIENIRLVSTGLAELAFTLADSAGTAASGTSPFPAPVALAALARLYDNYLHLVVHPDRP